MLGSVRGFRVFWSPLAILVRLILKNQPWRTELELLRSLVRSLRPDLPRGPTARPRAPAPAAPAADKPGQASAPIECSRILRAAR